MKVAQLKTNEYLSYYITYLSKAGSLSLLEGLEKSFNETLTFWNTLSDDHFEYAYAEGKWTIKELLQHIIDSERVFVYRALRFARADKTDLPGYDENDYAPASLANRRTKEELIQEYTTLRRSTIDLFKSFTDEMLLEIGTANGGSMSVRAIGFVIIGHEKHHCNVIKERYL